MFSFFSLSLSTILNETIEAEKKDTIKQDKVQEEEDNCITYNSSENLISITCKNKSFADISNRLQDSGIVIQQQQQSPSMNNNEKIWLLYAGIEVEKDATLDITSNDVTWLKIVPSKSTPNAIQVYGSLKIDSVKITSWNPEVIIM